MINFNITEIVAFKDFTSVTMQNIRLLKIEVKKETDKLFSDIDSKLNSAFSMMSSAQSDLRSADEVKSYNKYMLGVLKERKKKNEDLLYDAKNILHKLYEKQYMMPKPSSVPRPKRMEGETDNQFQQRLGDYQEQVKEVQNAIDEVNRAIYEVEEKIKVIEENIRILEEKIKCIEKMIEELDKIIKIVKNDIEVLEKHIENLKNARSILKKNFDNFNYNIDIGYANIENIDKRVSGIRRLLEDNRFEYCKIENPDVIGQAIYEITEHIKKIKRDIEDMALTIKETSKAINNVEFMEKSAKQLDEFSTELKYDYIDKLEEQKEKMNDTIFVLEQYLSYKLN